MKTKKALLLALLPGLLLSSCGSKQRLATEEYKAGEIAFRAGESELRILQLTDIHLSSKDNQDLQLKFLDLTINEAIAGGLDLIVLSGDTFTFADKATAKRFFDWLDGYGVKWTVTFGNHDEQCLFSVTWLTSFLNGYGSNCIFKDNQQDDVFGNANFYIDVKKEDNLFERIIILDSNRYYFNDYFGYDYLKQDQIDWYSRVINDSPTTKSLMFFHIPLPEFQTAYDLWKDGSSEVTYFGGENYEKVSAPKYNSGMFKAITDLNSTHGIFVGHDHDNDSAIEYKGVLLSYGTNSSDRVYFHEGMIGGQIITVKSDHSIELTRIHHEYSEVEK